MPKTEEEIYGAEQIQVLEGLDPVRKRPGMYIGSTSIDGLHHLVYEIVDNAIDEALAGFCTEITVDILPDNVIRVSDNGRGIPTGIHPTEGISAATVVYTVLHAGGKFGGGGYKVSGGLHGVGASVVNALSEWLEINVKDGAHEHFQHFDRGEYKEQLKVIGDTDETGTTVTFKADAQIFETTQYDYEVLLKRMREQAFLNAGIRIIMSDKRDPDEILSETLHYEGGIRQFVEHIHKVKGYETVGDIIYVDGREGDSVAEIAMQYNDSYNECIMSFANNIHTKDGGSHENGFKNALTKVVNEYGKRFNFLKENEKLSGDDVREGLTAIVSVKLTECEFEGQTKGRLGNPEVRPFVEKLVQEKLMTYFEMNPEIAKEILDKCLAARRAREAAKAARETARRKTAMESASCPASLRTALSTVSRTRRFTSSREIPRAALPRADVTAAIRRSSPSGARCSTWRKHASTAFTATTSSCPWSRRWAPASARTSISKSCVTTRSSSWRMPTWTAVISVHSC